MQLTPGIEDIATYLRNSQFSGALERAAALGKNEFARFWDRTRAGEEAMPGLFPAAMLFRAYALLGLNGEMPSKILAIGEIERITYGVSDATDDILFFHLALWMHINGRQALHLHGSISRVYNRMLDDVVSDYAKKKLPKKASRARVTQRLGDLLETDAGSAEKMAAVSFAELLEKLMQSSNKYFLGKPVETGYRMPMPYEINILGMGENI